MPACYTKIYLYHENMNEQSIKETKEKLKECLIPFLHRYPEFAGEIEKVLFFGKFIKLKFLIFQNCFYLSIFSIKSVEDGRMFIKLTNKGIKFIDRSVDFTAKSVGWLGENGQFEQTKTPEDIVQDDPEHLMIVKNSANFTKYVSLYS